MLQRDLAAEEYCLSKSTLPSSICEEIFNYTTNNIPRSTMLIGPLGGSLLGFLTASIRAKRILEIGSYTGYSALCMAEHLPDNGELITLDISEETTQVGKKFWKKSPHGKKIKLILGPALETLENLSGSFDFILIDADKTNYLAYLRRSLELLSPHGIIALDNCLWGGSVFDPSIHDADTKALREVADWVKSRDDLTSLLLPIRDGILLVQKRNKS